MTIKFKRKLKRIFKKDKIETLDFLFNKTIILTICIFTLFLLSQLLLNSMLTPQGVRLERLNNEKNILIENNREIAQEIARIRSISIIQEITEEQMNLKPLAENTIIFISNESVMAEL